MARITDFANERPAFPLYPPAITRNLVFRLGRDANPRSFETTTEWKEDEQRELRDKKWKILLNSISTFIDRHRLLHGVDTSKCHINLTRPSYSDTDSQIDMTLNAARTILVPIFDSNEYRIRIRIDVYTEILSINFIIDKISYGFVTDFLQINNNLDRSECISKLNSIYNDLWSDNNQNADLQYFLNLKSSLSETDIDIFREIKATLIADFRGLTIGCEDWNSIDFENWENYSDPTIGKLTKNLSDFYNSNAAFLSAVAARSRDFSVSDRDGEAVLCGMLGGRAIYACELAQWERQPPLVQPVCFFLVYDGKSDYQLGRLVRRLHVLGELRHLALLDYANAIDEQKSLREVSRQIRNLTGKVNLLMSDSGRALPIGTPHSDVDKAFSSALEIVKDLAFVNQYCDGGLNYRIEQSRYYASEFKICLQDTSFVKINTYQTYGEFVTRYIFKLFDRIDRIGKRHDHLERRVNSLMYLQQSRFMHDYQSGVQLALKSLNSAVEKMSDAASSMSNTSNKQYHTLVTAEIFAAAFLIYYFESVFYKAFEIAGPFSEYGYFFKTSLIVLSCLSIFGFSLVAIWRTVKGIKARRQEKKRTNI